jgi:peptide deformylase
MTKIVDYLVQENDPNEFDRSILHRQAFDVNMRLFRTSPFFRQIIMDIVNYMDAHLNMAFEDYPAPRGVSGVTLGFPFNVIGFKNKNVNKFCINPKIVRVSAETLTQETNCGSLRLAKPVKVLRYAQIDLEYYSLKGDKVVELNIGRQDGGLTIQHEVAHGLGLCATEQQPEA